MVRLREIQETFSTEDEDFSQKLFDLCEKSGYEITQSNGQRVYSAPSSWKVSSPPKGCEIFIGRLPKNLFEYEIVPLLETFGKLFNFRLMLDFHGKTRGYAFATYFKPEDAKRAVRMLNGFQIRKKISIGVHISVDNRRLFVGNIPMDKTKKDVLKMLQRNCDGVVDVILYRNHYNPELNRGFSFVEFENHRLAAMARRRFTPQNLIAWGRPLQVDWAEPLPDVDPMEMATVS